ncbi:MAG: TIGR01244 family phosphatase [Rhodobacter sp.]|nr:TIGR01244 family phosphatase [Rhodobacter sp.]
MDLRQITPDYAVAPQIEPADMTELATLGFTTVINNRPDMENPDTLQSDAMRAAAQAAGLAYVDNPVVNGAMTMDMVTVQGETVASSAGPVFAWCRSGTRSSIVWALSQAGKRPTAEIIAALNQAGYDIPGLDAQIESIAAQG